MMEFRQLGVILYTTTARLSWSIRNGLGLNREGPLPPETHRVKPVKYSAGMNIVERMSL